MFGVHTELRRVLENELIPAATVVVRVRDEVCVSPVFLDMD